MGCARVCVCVSCARCLWSLFLACDGPVLPESESGKASGNGKVRSSVSVPDAASGSSLPTMGRDRGARGPPAPQPLSTSVSTAPTDALAKVALSSGGTVTVAQNRIVLWFGFICVDTVWLLLIDSLPSVMGMCFTVLLAACIIISSPDGF
ncbi:hypothetical protein DPX16_17773 [Anabarilius grahami]|uniref:Uncharacterized protein n=1 Tax=Anabarilius grahami TaxID=495550 RepID=A0A3N0YHN8_ANAGA|nr:hypothetical protein DPX16_17773 [Anabarilius grahami]